MRGRQFGFLTLLAGLWCAGRMMIGQYVPEAKQSHVPKADVAQAPNQMLPEPMSYTESKPHRPHIGRSASHQRTVKIIPTAWAMSAHAILPSEALVTTHPIDQAHQPPALFPALASSGNTQRAQPRALHVYGYSFFRKASSSGLSAPGGQYGGSQSGFVVTWDIDPPRAGQDISRIALLARGAIAHGDTTEREIATGVRWRPMPRIPVSLSVERRFRPARGDVHAAYLVGGTSLALPRAFRLESYAQAGIVSGPAAGPFFDFSARADRAVVQQAAGTSRAGAGLWGGGQSSVFRIDVGPTVRTDIAIAKTNLRLSADWRFRIAGKATPASGPALTLSTSF